MNSKLKKILCLSLILLMFNSLAFGESNLETVEQKTWKETNITTILDNHSNFMTGYSNGKILKDNPMTVEQFISILVSASVDESEIGISNASKWSIPYIEKAKELNYIKPGEFKEKDYTRAITRGEATQLGVRAIESIEGSPQYRESERIQLAINDYISTAEKLRSDVIKGYDLGIVTSQAGNHFKSKEVLKNSEAKMLINRILNPSARFNIENNLCYKNSVSIVGGIKIDPKKDYQYETNGTNLSDLKLQEFAIKFFKTIKHTTGKVNYLEFEAPELPAVPEHYRWQLDIHIVYKNKFKITDEYGTYFEKDQYINYNSYFSDTVSGKMKAALSNKWSNVDKMYFIAAIINDNLDDGGRHVVYEYPSKMVRAYGSVYKQLEYKHISKFNFEK